MKFTIERDCLRSALDVASLALKESDKEPIHTHYLVKVGSDNRASLEASNRFLYCRAGMAVTEGAEGQMTIPGGPLKELAKLADDGPMVFETSEDDTVTVSSGQAKIIFTSLPSGDFLTPVEDLTKFTSQNYVRSHLTEALKYMKVFIGQDKSRLQYMVAELRNGRWMAQDGVKIGMYERPGFDGNVTIQTPALSSVLSFLKAAGGDAVKVTQAEQFCWVDDGVNLLAFRRDDRSFSKDIEAALENVEDQDHVTFNRDFLERVVQRLKIPLEGGNTRMEFLLSGEEAGTLTIRTINGRGKASAESIMVGREKGAGTDVSFAMDWRPLLETVQSEPFSEGRVNLHYIPSKSVVKLVREEEGMQAISLIALRP